MADGWQPLLEAIARIPSGRVASYGQIARIAGRPGQARQVGWALSSLEPGTPYPWHRVVNASGHLSLRSGAEQLQRRLLEAEGVHFTSSGRIDLARFGWRGD